ncbi:hypothetical protein [Methylosarcina fibrata]|uniref:hypothetical protein n=1 Tax=Methylosarcina fibrata TaxID=105972 RepID=UPI000361B1D1|nr:hypothetical protein [Methylosarcina fibrata]
MTDNKPKRGKSRNRQKPITVQISPEKTLTIDELRELCALNPWRSNLQTFDDVLMLCEAVPWEYRRFAGEAVPDIWEIIHRFDIDNKQLYRVMHGEWGHIQWDGGPPRPKSEQSDLEKRAAAEVTQIVCNLESSKNFLEFREYINANPVSAEAVIHMLYFYQNQCASEKDRLGNRKEKDREIVQEFWDKWQIDKSLYEGVTAFDNAMMDKTLISRSSMLDWRKILESGKRLV